MFEHRQNQLARLTGPAVAVAFTVLLWLLALVLWSANDLAKPGPLPQPLVTLLFQTFAIGIAFSTILAFAVLKTQRLPLIGRVAATALAAIAMGFGHGLIDAALVQDMSRALGHQPPTLGKLFVSGLMPFLLIYPFYAAMLGLMCSAEASRRSERELAAARDAAQEARLAALRFQLNPHFLFNTLNAISSLIVNGRNDEAEAMTMRLSSFLRTSLEADMQNNVTLDEELATLQSYLDIEAVRFGNRLRFEVACPVHLLEAQVPSFLLQPLAENAVKYAVAPSRRPVTIAVLAEQRGDVLLLTVRDDGAHALQARPAGGTGLGIANVRQRLATHYGDRSKLEAVALDSGFVVQIEMPLDLQRLRIAAE